MPVDDNASMKECVEALVPPLEWVQVSDTLKRYPCHCNLSCNARGGGSGKACSSEGCTKGPFRNWLGWQKVNLLMMVYSPAKMARANGSDNRLDDEGGGELQPDSNGSGSSRSPTSSRGSSRPRFRRRQEIEHHTHHDPMHADVIVVMLCRPRT